MSRDYISYSMNQRNPLSMIIVIKYFLSPVSVYLEMSLTLNFRIKSTFQYFSFCGLLSDNISVTKYIYGEKKLFCCSSSDSSGREQFILFIASLNESKFKLTVGWGRIAVSLLRKEH